LVDADSAAGHESCPTGVRPKTRAAFETTRDGQASLGVGAPGQRERIQRSEGAARKNRGVRRHCSRSRPGAPRVAGPKWNIQLQVTPRILAPIKRAIFWPWAEATGCRGSDCGCGVFRFGPRPFN